MSHRLAILRSKILAYLSITFVAVFVYLAIATWDTTLNWKFLSAGIFTFIVFIVTMFLWDEEETQMTNELKEQSVAQMKMAKIPTTQAEALPNKSTIVACLYCGTINDTAATNECNKCKARLPAITFPSSESGV